MKVNKLYRLSILFFLLGAFQVTSQSDIFAAESVSAPLQQITVTGVVSDNTGITIPGANVMVRGTTFGAVTDVDGRYSINVPNAEAVLVYTYIGYVTQEIVVGIQTTINVTLMEDAQELDELIVVGYGTMRRSDLTGAVARVNMEEQESLANVTISQALSGASPGINIQPTGLAGQDPVISIRGQNSFTGSQDPLIVLDGIIYYGAISDINVSDVETIDILKDASAAAVYGSRSANGVIIITTKKGKEGKPRINFNMYYGQQWMTNNPMRVMNAEEYTMRLVDFVYQEELYKWYATSPTNDAGRPARPDLSSRQAVIDATGPYMRGEEPANYLAGKEIDWVDKVINKSATIQSYNISFSGRADRFNYFASASYLAEEGVLKFDYFKRYTIHANVDSKITDWLSIGLNTTYSNRDNSGMNANMEFARVASPLANDDTDLPVEERAMYLIGENYMRHPLEREGVQNREIRDNIFFVTSARLTLPWVPGLSYDIKYANNFSVRQDDRFYPAFVHDGLSQNGTAERRPQFARGWVLDNIISYLQSYGDHSVNATLLYSRDKRYGTSYTFRSQRFENPVLGFENMSMGSLYGSADPSAYLETSVAYMGRLNYTYKNRYMITGTVRRDGSSTFSPNHKWAVFPSISVGWVLSDEAFMSDLDWLYTKLRVSYGLNGNPGAGRYSSLARAAYDYYQWGSTMTLAVYPDRGNMGNLDLRWEKTSSFNVGVDFALYRRVNGSIEVYDADTKDVIVQRTLPRSSGFTGIRTNLGGVNNKGIEIGLNTINLQNTEIKWRSGFSFSLNRNKITDLYGDGTKRDLGNEWFIGEPIGAIWDYEKNGIWQEEDLFEGRIGPNGSILKGNVYPGHYRLTDISGGEDADGRELPPDGVINANDDRKIIGYRVPNYRFSITNTFNYKNWGLFVMINSVQGGKSGGMQYYMQNVYRNVNVQDRADDVRRINQSAIRPYWTPENRVNNATGVNNVPATPIGGIYEDRSFVRLQDVSLTYNFNRQQLSSMGGFIDQLQIFVSGRNLYTWTKFPGWDPEIFYFRQTGGNRDTQNEHNIAMRNVTAGVKITF